MMTPEQYRKELDMLVGNFARKQHDLKNLRLKQATFKMDDMLYYKSLSQEREGLGIVKDIDVLDDGTIVYILFDNEQRVINFTDSQPMWPEDMLSLDLRPIKDHERKKLDIS